MRLPLRILLSVAFVFAAVDVVLKFSFEPAAGRRLRALIGGKELLTAAGTFELIRGEVSQTATGMFVPAPVPTSTPSRAPPVGDKALQMLRTLTHVQDALRAHRVTDAPWLMFGSLIGAMREGSLLPSDDDVDLGVTELANFSALERLCRGEDVLPELVCTKSQARKWYRLLHGATGVRTDLYVYYKDAAGRWINPFNCRTPLGRRSVRAPSESWGPEDGTCVDGGVSLVGGIALSDSQLHPHQAVVMGGVKFLVPRRAWEFLHGNYGPGVVVSGTEKFRLPFSSIVYINLATSAQRQSAMELSLARTALPYTRFPAVTRAAAEAYAEARGLALAARTKTRESVHKWGTVACYLSHLEVLGSDALRGTDPVMVLEDDVDFAPRWKSTLAEAWFHLPDDWDMVKTCYFGEPRDADRVNEYFYKPSRPFMNDAGDGGFHYLGTCGYVVRPASVPKVRNFLKDLALGAGIDDVDIALLEAPHISTYVVSYATRIGTHGAHGSDRVDGHRGYVYGPATGYYGYGRSRAYGYRVGTTHAYGYRAGTTTSSPEDATEPLSPSGQPTHPSLTTGPEQIFQDARNEQTGASPSSLSAFI